MFYVECQPERIWCFQFRNRFKPRPTCYFQYHWLQERTQWAKSWKKARPQDEVNPLSEYLVANKICRPCFVPDSKLKYLLTRYANKEELSMPKSQNSIYQQGFGMVFCNPAPIATASYLGKEAVTSGIQAFIEAVANLTQLGHNLNIDFGFCRVQINNRNLSYTYKQDLSRTLNATSFESKIKKAEVTTASFWQTSSQSKWQTSK